MSLPSVKGTFKSVNKSSLDRVMGHVTRPGGVGILSPSRFDVYIGGAASGIITDVASRQSATRQTLSVEALRRLSESCESVNFPGRSLSSQPNRISGPVREMPYESLYSGDLDITFRVGGDMFERQYFESKSCIDPSRITAASGNLAKVSCGLASNPEILPWAMT